MFGKEIPMVGLITGDELKRIKNLRKQEYLYKSEKPAIAEAFIEKEGWELDKELKTKTRIRKRKPEDEIFENKVWNMFYQMGFSHMNEDRHFEIAYSKDGKLKKQIDVFAMDDETILLVECKKSLSKNKLQEFKTELESIRGNMDGIRQTLKTEFPDHKIKFIFATEDYILGEADIARMQEFQIAYFDEEKVNYYTELSNHLGNASRYQLLGNLFKGEKIPQLKNVVPAIRGEMGGHTYYSFSVEPDILLKLGYVLHRNDSNKDSMPTYQRIIKKSRLKSVQEFVENKGYFPNSIIVSISTGRKGCRFDFASNQSPDSLSKIGLLHLPQLYRSIYIIDGQHRLYGYANSDYRYTNTIPVVAFENLDQEEQIKIFMDINENQKAVPKNLRNTLDEDLKYESDDPKERRDALTLKIARELGEDKLSPLYGRVVIGENTYTPERALTLEQLSKALREGDYLSKYSKGQLIKAGLFDLDDNDKSFEKVYPFLKYTLYKLKKYIGESEWNNTNDNKDAFIKNNVISGFLRALNSVCLYINYEIQVLTASEAVLEEKIDKYIKIIANYWNGLSNAERIELATSYGAGGPIKYQRTFEKEINKMIPAFSPEGMKEYWEDRDEKNAAEAKDILKELLSSLKDYFKTKLDDYYIAEDKYDEWLSNTRFVELSTEVTKQNVGKSKAQYIDIWDLVGFEDLHDILNKGAHWTEVFDKLLGYSDDNKGDKKVKTEWLINLKEIQDKLKTSNMITKDNFDYLGSVKVWLSEVI